MRRNVRRLNREVGGVVVAVATGRGGAAAAAAPKGNTISFTGEDLDSAIFGEEATSSAGKKNSRNNNSTKKAANLSELKKYCKAAEEAAREVLLETENTLAAAPMEVEAVDKSRMDVHSLATLEDSLPLKSPSRMVAMQLANSNPTFREKLKKKLEESGVTFEMEDFAGFGGALPIVRAIGRGNTKGGKPPLSGVNDYDEKGSKPLKMRQKRKSNQIEEEDKQSSIIRRRRKAELQISINGTAAQIHAAKMDPPNGTPYRGYGVSSTGSLVGAVSPLNADKHVVFGDDLYCGGLGSLGNLIGLPVSDTPGKNGIATGTDASQSSTPRFDFDEVVQHFPSPRGSGGPLGSSPSRWSGGSAGSFGSGTFNFPDSSKSKDGQSVASLKQNSHSKRNRRTSNSNGVDGNLDGLALPSPMSALPSPTFADMASSFLNATSGSHHDSDYKMRSPRSSLGSSTNPNSAIKKESK